MWLEPYLVTNAFTLNLLHSQGAFTDTQQAATRLGTIFYRPLLYFPVTDHVQPATFTYIIIVAACLVSVNAPLLPCKN